MKKLTILILLLITTLSLCACSSKNTETETKAEVPALVGCWEYEGISEISYNFNEDGTGFYDFYDSISNFTYEDSGDSVTIQYENSDAPNVYNYTIEGNKLAITDDFGEIVNYVKK